MEEKQPTAAKLGGDVAEACGPRDVESVVTCGAEGGEIRNQDESPFLSGKLRARSCKAFESSYRKPKQLSQNHRPLSDRARSCFCKRTPLQVLLRYLPFINMLMHYDVKKYLVNDIIAGLSVSVLHVGQGLGYAAVAGLPPISGVHVSFFHLAIYFIFGTSNQMSVGTNTLTSLLVVSVVNRETAAIQGASSSGQTGVQASTTTAQGNYSNDSYSGNSTRNNTGLTADEIIQFQVGVAATMSFLVGIVLCLLSLLRFGNILAMYISPVFVSSFTCASAFHVASSQVRYAAFGRGQFIGGYSGPLKLYYILRDLFVNFLKINWLCSVCFLSSMVILLAIKVGINKNPKFRHRLFMPIPADLMVIVLFTGLSYAFAFENIPNQQSGVQVMGKMKPGLPAPSVPSFYNWTDYIGDAVLTSILIYILNFTMANFFKEKYKYKVDYNQEMLAPGLCHLFASFFSCFPGATAPPRCFLQDAAGCKTQVSGLVSCVVLVIVLYFIAPYLYYLPFAVVGAMIWVSLKRLVIQLRDLKAYWYQDKIDFIAWIVCFVATIILDVQYGLIVGIIFHILTVVVRVQLNNVYVVGKVDHDRYDDVKKYDSMELHQHILVLRYNSPILFLNSTRFVNLALKVSRTERSTLGKVEALVIDCTHVSFMDTAAVKSLAKLRKALSEDGVALYFSGCSPPVRRKLSVCDESLYQSAFLTIYDVELDLKAQRSIASDKSVPDENAAL